MAKKGVRVTVPGVKTKTTTSGKGGKTIRIQSVKKSVRQKQAETTIKENKGSIQQAAKIAQIISNSKSGGKADKQSTKKLTRVLTTTSANAQKRVNEANAIVATEKAKAKAKSGNKVTKSIKTSKRIRGKSGR